MSHEVYANQILEPVVKPWLKHSDGFVLEEDGDSGYGGKRHGWKGANTPPPGTKRRVAENPVQCWKRENSLKFYFNCYSSPDFSPIENCWQGPGAKVKNLGHFDSETTREPARTGEYFTRGY